MAYLLIGVPAAIAISVLLVKTARQRDVAVAPVKEDDSFEN